MSVYNPESSGEAIKSNAHGNTSGYTKSTRHESTGGYNASSFSQNVRRYNIHDQD